MKPKLNSVIYSGCLDSEVFVLFENLFYLIVAITNGAVESFTLSEITGYEPLEEIIDVKTF